MKDQELYVLKLGGSLLTNKDTHNSIRYDIIDLVIQQIIDANEKMILVHGGGSFGHPLAKKYHLSDGIDDKIADQIYGLVETHQSMNRLNSIIINSFLEKKYPALSIQTSSSFIQESQKILSQAMNIIEATLDLKILPILYGDIILDMNGSFSIISGDQIIFQLCRDLHRYKVTKVIFAMDVDGIYIKTEKENRDYKLAKLIHSDVLKDIKLANLGQKIDVTGGIEGKIKVIERILQYKIPVQLINGLKEGYIFRSLKNHTINCTTLLPSK